MCACTLNLVSMLLCNIIIVGIVTSGTPAEEGDFQKVNKLQQPDFTKQTVSVYGAMHNNFKCSDFIARVVGCELS